MNLSYRIPFQIHKQKQYRIKITKSKILKIMKIMKIMIILPLIRILKLMRNHRTVKKQKLMKNNWKSKIKWNMNNQRILKMKIKKMKIKFRRNNF